MALRLDDLNEVNRDLLAATKELLAIGETTKDPEIATKLSEEVGRLSDLSRRLSLATRSIANVTLAFLESLERA